MKTYLPLLILLIHLLTTSPVLANDIASSVRDGRTEADEDGGTLEVGAAFGYLDNPHIVTQGEYDGWELSLDASGEIRYKDFFFEASQGTQDGSNLGYTLWHNDRWAFDFLAASMIGSINSEFDGGRINDSDDEATRNKKLENQDTFYAGTGFRVTHYLDNYVLQYRFVADSYRDNGVVSTLRLGRGWQIRNWHLSTIVSAKYSSDRTNDYLYGVADNEATAKYPAFDATSSKSYSVLFNLTKPLSEKWVMRAYWGRRIEEDKLEMGPLLDNNDLTFAAVAISYVIINR